MSLPLFQKRRSSVSASTLVNFLTLNSLPPCFLFKFLCQLHANIFIAFYIFCALCEEHSYSLSFLRSGFPNLLINILTPTGHTHTHRLLLCYSMSMTGSERPLLSKAERSHICSLSVRFMSQQQLRLLFPVLSLSAASESAVLSLSLCVLSSVNSLTEESCKINFHRLVVQQKKERKSCRR